MGVLGNHLLNCAGFHASDRGFGIATLNEDNYTWVLSRLAVELDEMPYQYENFSVQTWVENVYRLFTDRNFAIIDKDGKKIGYARSVWAMINLNTRKPADLLTLHGGSIVDYVCDEPCPIEKPSRIKVTFGHVRHLETADTFGLVQLYREQIKDMLNVTDAVHMTVNINITVFCRQGSH